MRGLGLLVLTSACNVAGHWACRGPGKRQTVMRPFIAVATGYDKLAVRQEASVLVAAINAWL